MSDDRTRRMIVARLRVDGWTAEAVGRLRAAGVEPVLLKGPVTLDWLYPHDRGVRAYGDVDLLVAPGDFERATTTLQQAGFALLGDVVSPWDAPHARSLKRPGDGAEVDLHRVVHGTEGIPAAAVWEAFSAGHDRQSVGGVEVRIPGEAARALHLVLHLTPEDESGSWSAAYVERALELLPEATWREAAGLARRLGVADELGHRLTLLPAGRPLAEALGLPTAETPLYASLRLAGTSAAAPGLHSLLALAGPRGLTRKLAYVRDKLLPPREVLRDRYPLARRGRRGLVAVRGAWLATCVARTPGAVRAALGDRGARRVRR